MKTGISLSDFIENYKKSGREMELNLFKPLDFKKWLKLGFLSFFNVIPPFLFLFFLNFIIIPSRFLNWNKIFPFLPHIFMVFPFLFFIFLIFFSIFVYISGYSSYFYLEFLLQKRDNLGYAFLEHRELAFQYFILNIFLYLLLAFSMFAGLSAILFFREFLSKFFVFSFALFFILIFALVSIFIKDIYIPLSYFKKGTLMENLNSALEIISLNTFKFFSFSAIKILLIIILGLGIVFMGFMSFGILFLFFIIPVLGQTILQPVICFLNLFGLNFFKNLTQLKQTG